MSCHPRYLKTSLSWHYCHLWSRHCIEWHPLQRLGLLEAPLGTHYQRFVRSSWPTQAENLPQTTYISSHRHYQFLQVGQKLPVHLGKAYSICVIDSWDLSFCPFKPRIFHKFLDQTYCILFFPLKFKFHQECLFLTFFPSILFKLLIWVSQIFLLEYWLLF